MLYITILKPKQMYRSRLGTDLDTTTLDYVSSIDNDKEIAPYDIIGSQAHVIMLYENKIIKKNSVKKILLALEELKRKSLTNFKQSEDIHELIESLVIKKIGQKSGGQMHTARSRNDQVSLDMRMKIRDDINTLCSCLLDTIESIILLAKKHQKTIIPLYTHLQQAQVGVLSHYLLAHVDALFRDIDRLYVTYGRVNESPLGGGAVGGTSIAIDRNYTAKLLGFKGLVENSIDATSTRDFVAEYISSVAIMMTNLSKIAEDLIIWSTSEFSFVELDDKLASPSSVMPQKKNPDILELTRGKTAEIIGYLTAVLSTIKGLATGYGRDLQQLKLPILNTSRIGIYTLIIYTSLFSTLKVNQKQMKNATNQGYLIALDVAEKLVKEGVPFRTAHKVVGKLVQTAHKTKKPLSKLTQNEITSCTKTIKIEPKKIRKILLSTNLQSSLKERNSLGSSGFLEQKRMIDHRMGKIRMYQEGTTKRTNEVKRSMTKLEDKIKFLTS